MSETLTLFDCRLTVTGEKDDLAEFVKQIQTGGRRQFVFNTIPTLLAMDTPLIATVVYSYPTKVVYTFVNPYEPPLWGVARFGQMYPKLKFCLQYAQVVHGGEYEVQDHEVFTDIRPPDIPQLSFQIDEGTG